MADRAKPLMDNVHELPVGPRLINLTIGDITKIHADAIINAANEPLIGGGGVDGAIHRVGGPAIMADLEARYGRSRHCPTGQAVPSIAGDLDADWVIHAVGPVWRGATTASPISCDRPTPMPSASRPNSGAAASPRRPSVLESTGIRSRARPKSHSRPRSPVCARRPVSGASTLSFTPSTPSPSSGEHWPIFALASPKPASH